MRWRLMVAGLVVRARPRQVLAQVAISTLVATMVLSLPLGGGSPRGVLLALPLALAITGVAHVWHWATAVRSMPAPLLDAVDGIETDRLLLRRATRHDVAGYLASLDSVVMDVNGLTPKHSRRASDVIRAGLGTVTLVVEQLSGTVIGVVTILPREMATCEVGWWIRAEHRSKRYGTEAIRAVFSSLHGAGVHRIIVGTSPDNVAVHRVMAKLGADLTHSGPHQLPNGTTVDSDWYIHTATESG